MSRFGVSAICIVGLCTAIACDKGDKKKDAAATAAASSKPAAAATASAATTTAAASGSAKAGKKEKKKEAKAKLDKGKPNAKFEGTAVDVPGTDGTFLAPKGWSVQGNDKWSIVTDPAEHVGFVAANFEKGEDPTPLLGEFAQALKVSDCEWGGTEAVTIGKDDLDAVASDGVCVQGDGKSVYVLYILVPADGINLFLAGAYDEDASQDEIDKVAEVLKSVGKGEPEKGKKGDKKKGKDDDKDDD